jgi:hypothetical protein
MASIREILGEEPGTQRRHAAKGVISSQQGQITKIWYRSLKKSV